MSQRGVNWRTGFYIPRLKLTKPSCVEEVRLVMLLLSGMTENELKLTKTSCVEEVMTVEDN